MTLEQTNYSSFYFSPKNEILKSATMNEYYVYNNGEKTALYFDSTHKVIAKKLI
jgi:hypothetical protein